MNRLIPDKLVKCSDRYNRVLIVEILKTERSRAYISFCYRFSFFIPNTSILCNDEV
ncbi:hypothetical protein IQ259_13140 [Fortiea sp. LEGE XX443]|uniref:hypothetical protein n=1 Tax=Fortiea sp. LEGE XX443 TaxID=1828611 RepID=UPI00188167DC|nr:hypothetical protein [Fortiea sp. LEGE XX443]MBE9005968.1 hypothetical protein [Fortiea sp. LEGE XX443]